MKLLFWLLRPRSRQLLTCNNCGGHPVTVVELLPTGYKGARKMRWRCSGCGVSGFTPALSNRDARACARARLAQRVGGVPAKVKRSLVGLISGLICRYLPGFELLQPQSQPPSPIVRPLSHSEKSIDCGGSIGPDAGAMICPNGHSDSVRIIIESELYNESKVLLTLHCDECGEVFHRESKEFEEFVEEFTAKLWDDEILPKHFSGV